MLNFRWVLPGSLRCHSPWKMAAIRPKRRGWLSPEASFFRGELSVLGSVPRKFAKFVPWNTNLEPENHSPMLGSWNPNVRAENDSFQVRNGRGCQKCVTSKFIGVWMFEPQKCLSFFFGDSLSSKTHRENYTQRKVRFWILGIEAINFFRYKVGPYDLTTPMSRVKEPKGIRPFIRVITPSISGIWPTSYELLFFNFQGLSIHTFWWRAFDSLGGEHLSLDSSNL